MCALDQCATAWLPGHLSQCDAQAGDQEAHLRAPGPLAAAGGQDGRGPPAAAATRPGGTALPVGIPVPAEPGALAAGAAVLPAQQHQLPGAVHDQRGAVLRGAAHLRQHGDVPRRAAALPPRQGLPLPLRLLGRVRHVPGAGAGGAGACLAALLQQEAPGLLVQQHTGEEAQVRLPRPSLYMGTQAVRTTGCLPPAESEGSSWQPPLVCSTPHVTRTPQP